MAGDPWSFIAQLIGGAATYNAKNAASGARQSEKNPQAYQPGMSYGQAPQLDRTASDNSTPASVVGNIGDMVSPGSSSMVKPLAGIGQAVQAEKDMYAPVTSQQGGYVSNPWATLYKNYMRYGQ